MTNKNKFIISTVVALWVITVSSVFADDSATGSTSWDTGTGVVTSTWMTSTGIIVWWDRDEHWCIGSAGYSWSGSINKCTRPWENNSGSTTIWTSRDDMKDQIMKNRDEMENNWKNFHIEDGILKDYMKKGLTKKDNVAIKAAVKTYQNDVKALIEEARAWIKNETFNSGSYNQKVDEVFARNSEALLVFVDSAKVDSFKKFMDDRKAVLKANRELRFENKMIRKAFTDKQRDMLKQRLDKVNKAVLSRLVTKIDELVMKSKNQDLIDKLLELKDIANENIGSN
jgi:hypothetical protein